MITITKQFNFKAKDFFDYLEEQLIPAIKKARGNDMPVTLAKGTKYEVDGALAAIQCDLGRTGISGRVHRARRADQFAGHQRGDRPAAAHRPRAAAGPDRPQHGGGPEQRRHVRHSGHAGRSGRPGGSPSGRAADRGSHRRAGPPHPAVLPPPGALRRGPALQRAGAAVGAQRHGLRQFPIYKFPACGGASALCRRSFLVFCLFCLPCAGHTAVCVFLFCFL